MKYLQALQTVLDHPLNSIIFWCFCQLRVLSYIIQRLYRFIWWKNYLIKLQWSAIFDNINLLMFTLYRNIWNWIHDKRMFALLIGISYIQYKWFCMCHSVRHCVPNTHARFNIWLKKIHDDVFKWKHFPRYWPFVRGIHRSPVPSQRPVTQSFYVFLDLRLAPEQTVRKQSRRRLFETPSCSLWRHWNAIHTVCVSLFCCSQLPVDFTHISHTRTTSRAV